MHDRSKFSRGLFITLFWITGYATAYTYLAPFLREAVNMNTSMVSITMLVLGVFAMIGSRLGGYGADRWGTAKTIFVSLIIHALALILLPVLAASAVTAIAVAAIWFGSAWMTSPNLQTYFIQQAPDSSDLTLSLNTSVLHLGIALGAGSGGIMVNLTGSVANTLWLGGCTVILGMASALVSFSIRKQRKFS